MNASWRIVLAVLVAGIVFPDVAETAGQVRGYNLVGEIRIQSVQPSNPLGRDLFRRRVFVRLRTDGKKPTMELQLRGDPQTCVFPLKKLHNAFEVGSAEACSFKAGGFGGRLWLPRGMVLQEKEQLSFEGLAVVEWMGHKGQARFQFAGPRDKALEKR